MSGDELRRLSADLTQAGEQAKQRADVAVRKTAFDIQGDAQQLAPVDTGNLRNSIIVATAPGSARAVITPTANYAIYVELGTSRMAAKPFLGPATDRWEPAFHEAMRQVMDT